MKLFIPKDMLDNPTPPNIYLCTTSKKIIGQLPAYDISGTFKWNAYSELQLSIDRQYTDILTGQTSVNPLFDKAEGLRKIYVENIGYFVIQDPDSNYADKDTKTLSCFSSEYETGTKYLENFRINTGEVDSAEVIALAEVEGDNYTIDTPYVITNSAFDLYESYYIKDYTDNDSYVYQRVDIKDANEYSAYDGSTVAKTLYIKKYPNVRFYWPTRPELSLLHLVFAKIPGWTIKNVDATLWRKERKFDEDRISVYDFLMNEVSEKFKCVVEWDTITNEVSFYEEAEDGITEENTVQTRWDTDVYISRDNLASEINIKYSTDDIKTKLKVSGADNLDIREVNLGKNHIINLDYYHNYEWMEQDLYEQYKKYKKAVETYSPEYAETVQGWVAAYNKWNDLMNAVPAEGNVVLVGDEFKKLYCVYTPIYEEGADQATINAAIDTAVSALTEKLKIYRVNEDVDANKTDNILLRLNNADGDTATIRIYNNGTELSPEYLIKTIIANAASGLESASNSAFEPTLRQWVTGATTVDNNGAGGMSDLKGFKVSYIGTMGAYFVLAKDETVETNIEDYGVNLLREKQKTYTTIFQTQTEAMYSQEKYQCTASNNPPSEPVSENTRWFDTDSNPPTLYRRTGEPASASFEERWQSITTDANPADLENYQRYIDNYKKLQTVQKVLLKKEREAEYCLDGYIVPNRHIDLSKYYYDERYGALRRKNGQTLMSDMQVAAAAHFGVQPDTIIPRVIAPLNTDLPAYYFIEPATMYYELAEGAFNEYEAYHIKTAEGYEKVDVTEETYDSYDGSTETTTLYVVRGRICAVYLKGTTPYVAYEESRGAYQALMDWMSNETDFDKFFPDDLGIRISPFIREDEFSDDSYLLTGYESEEERMEIGRELMQAASKELQSLCQPSLEFSMTMANILALPEFRTLTSQFQLGNFVRVHIRDGYIKRARLLEVQLSFDDLSDFSCNFGNLITTKSEIDKHADLLAQAVTAGKQVATSAGDWQRAVDKSSSLEEEIANGLQNVALEVGRASGQSIVWDSSGIWGRKLIDGTTDQYEDEQFRIINNKLVFSNDGFKTSKAMIGSYTINGETRWGPLAEYVTADTIEGKFIKGGSVQIGDETKPGGNLFIVHEDGSVEIKSNGVDKYATVSAVDVINKAYEYSIGLEYTGSTIFTNPQQECEVRCRVYKWGEEISLPSDTQYKWFINGKPYKTTTATTITIKSSDIENNAQLNCQVEFDDTKIE